MCLDLGSEEEINKNLNDNTYKNNGFHFLCVVIERADLGKCQN